MTSCMSSHTGRFAGGLRSRYAGWKVTLSGTPSNSYHVPRTRVIPGSSSPVSPSTAVLPSATRISGLIARICALRKPMQAARSSGSGVRLFGGRHFTMFPM